VGIGTSSPQFRFNSVQNNGATAPSVTGSIQVYAKGFGGGSQQYAGIGFAMHEHTNGYWGSGILARDDTGSYGSALAFYTSTGSATPTPLERVRIDSSGNIQIATTTALASARVSVSVTPGGTEVGRRLKPTSNATYYPDVYENSSGTTVGSISVSSSATTYSTSSDYRLKHDIAPMTGALAKVQALKPVTYKWNADDSNGEGFIAHELAEVCPSAVIGEKDAVNEDGSIKPQGIDTSFLVATLTAAIQEQQAIITQLTARIEALEAPAGGNA
jgi:hypothetical protein